MQLGTKTQLEEISSVRISLERLKAHDRVSELKSELHNKTLSSKDRLATIQQELGLLARKKAEHEKQKLELGESVRMNQLRTVDAEERLIKEQQILNTHSKELSLLGEKLEKGYEELDRLKKQETELINYKRCLEIADDVIEELTGIDELVRRFRTLQKTSVRFATVIEEQKDAVMKIINDIRKTVLARRVKHRYINNQTAILCQELKRIKEEKELKLVVSEANQKYEQDRLLKSFNLDIAIENLYFFITKNEYLKRLAEKSLWRRAREIQRSGAIIHDRLQLEIIESALNGLLELMDDLEHSEASSAYRRPLLGTPRRNL